MHPFRAALCLLMLAAPGRAPAAVQPASEPVPSNPEVKRGVDLWEAGDHIRAVSAWRGPAEAGDADAQFNLAQAYKLGRGVPGDQRQAERWYRKAAEQGHEQAAGFLGLIMFQNGDRAGALPWISKAADKGDPRAQYVLGTALFNGEQIPRDWPRAYALMTRSAAAGLPQATSTLQQMNQFIPLPDRQRGSKLATELARTAPAPAPSAAAPVRTVRTQSPAPVAAPARPRSQTATLPTARPAPKIAQNAAAPPRGRWRIQLGAFGSEQAARAAWTGMKARSTGLAGLAPSYERAGAVVRLKAGPLADRAAATRACAATRAAAGCFAVAP